jgi:hypothetical protein
LVVPVALTAFLILASPGRAAVIGEAVWDLENPVAAPSAQVNFTSRDNNLLAYAYAVNVVTTGAKFGTRAIHHDTLASALVTRPNDTPDLDGAYAELSISFWISPTTNSGDIKMVRRTTSSSGNPGYIEISRVGGIPRVIYRSPSGVGYTSALGNDVLALNTYSLITMTFDHGIVKMYVNGVLDFTKDNTVGGTIPDAASIGASTLTGTKFQFDVQAGGYLDEVGIFPYVLSQDDVTYLTTHSISEFIPEPASMVLLLCGAAALLAPARRRSAQ